MKSQKIKKPKSQNKAARGATVEELCAAMERIAPTWAAEEWDNVGLIVGDLRWPARRVLLTIDLTAAVLDEAAAGRSDAIVSYHPPIFKPGKSMRVDRSSQNGLAAEALSRRIAVYSPHTALDAAPGGTNDAVVSLCGLVDVTPLAPEGDPDAQCKLVTFVPQSHEDKVAEAIFAAGAGRIGDYDKCSFRVSGCGTFFGGDAAKPAVGKKGRLERVPEVRLEVIFSERRLGDVVAAMRASHPYEEPAFDVYKLAALPEKGLGPGRVGRFARPVRVGALAASLKRKTHAANVTLVGDPRAAVRRGLVCVGSAGRLPFDAPGGCGRGDVIVTGEIRHHDALAYQRAGAAAIALGHWASERPVLRPLAARLQSMLSAVQWSISRADGDPFAKV